MMSKAAISWGSKKQQSVALSSCEAEIVAASEAAKEAIYLDRLYEELGFKENTDPIKLYLDNKAAIDSSTIPRITQKITLARSISIDVTISFASLSKRDALLFHLCQRPTIMLTSLHVKTSQALSNVRFKVNER